MGDAGAAGRWRSCRPQQCPALSLLTGPLLVEVLLLRFCLQRARPGLGGGVS